MSKTRDNPTTEATPALTTRVQELDAVDGAVWDQYVAGHGDGSPYQLTAWMRAVEQGYGHAGWGVSAWRGDSLAGVLPLSLVNRPLGGAELVSLPFCDHGGILADDAVVAERLQEEAVALAEQVGARHLEIRTLGGTLEPAPSSSREEAASPPKVSMQSPLPEDSDSLFKQYKPKLRSQIRKAEKNGLEANISTANEAIDAFYPVFAANMHRLGSPVHSLAWFRALKYHYGDRLIVGQVFHGERVVGAGIVLMVGEQACIPWASTLAEFNHLAPNMLLYWTLLSHVCDQGARCFDFGRSTLEEGTYRFKKQWGAQPCVLHWYRVGAGGEHETLAGASPSAFKQRVRHWIELIWRQLPLGIANEVGPRLRKYITL